MMADGKWLCGFCHHGREANDVCGKLWTLSTADSKIAAHHKCMQYSSGLEQFKTAAFGGFKLKKVEKEIKRGRSLKCFLCKNAGKTPSRGHMTGATAGCALASCGRSFHFYCAAKDDKVITRRTEVTEKGEGMVVQYLVFCKEEHLRRFEDQKRKSNHCTIRYVSDSEDSEGEDSQKALSTCDMKSEKDSELDEDDAKLMSKDVFPSSDSEDGAGSKRLRERPVKKPRLEMGTTKNGGDRRVIGTLETIDSSCDSKKVNGPLKKAVSNGSVSAPVASPCSKSADHKPRVLCLLEGIPSHPDPMAVLRERATELYSVSPRAAHLWQGRHFPHLKPHHMIYYFMQLSQAIRDQDTLRLSQLMFSPSEDDAASFEAQYQADSARGNWGSQCKSMRRSLQENLVAAKMTYGQEVGRAVKENQLQTMVVLLLLDDRLDPKVELRRQLHSHTLYKWAQHTSIQAVFNTNHSHTQEAELTELKYYLSKFIHEMEVIALPSDEFLQQVKPEGSVTHALWMHLREKGAEPGEGQGGTLAFIGPVQEEVMAQRTCVLHAMHWLMSKRLTPNCRVCCVFDVGEKHGMTRAVNMICDMPTNAQVRLFSAVNPELEPVTCLIVEAACTEDSSS